MKSFAPIFTVLLFACSAYANGPGENLDINNDRIITDDINADNIFINDSIKITNYANIDSEQIVICNGCLVEFTSFENVAARFYSDDDTASLIQFVNCTDTINKISAADDLNFTIQIESNSSLSMTELENISGDADKIIFSDSKITLDKIPNFNAPIEIVGELYLNVGNQPIEGLLFSNVKLYSGSINIISPGLNSLYTAKTVVQNENIYLQVGRETDYSKIFNNDLGLYLGQLRTASPNNKLLAQMDAAPDMISLQNIMNDSAQINPINLMKPIEVFNSFKTASLDKEISNNSFDGNAFYILSESFDMMGIDLSYNKKFNFLDIIASVYYGALNNSDDINDFGGNLYGLNISGHYQQDENWAAFILGYTKADFETDSIFNDGDEVQNPSGNSIYAAADFGIYKYKLKEFEISPFVGLGFNSVDILSDSVSDFYAKGGGSIRYSSTVIGMKKDFDAFISMQTNNVFNAGLKFSFWSFADNAGGDITYSINVMDNVISNNISAGFNLSF